MPWCSISFSVPLFAIWPLVSRTHHFLPSTVCRLVADPGRSVMSARFRLPPGRSYNVRATELERDRQHTQVVCNVLLLDNTVQAFKVSVSTHTMLRCPPLLAQRVDFSGWSDTLALYLILRAPSHTDTVTPQTKRRRQFECDNLACDWHYSHLSHCVITHFLVLTFVCHHVFDQSYYHVTASTEIPMLSQKIRLF